MDQMHRTQAEGDTNSQSPCITREVCQLAVEEEGKTAGKGQ